MKWIFILKGRRKFVNVVKVYKTFWLLKRRIGVTQKKRSVEMIKEKKRIGEMISTGFRS